MITKYKSVKSIIDGIYRDFDSPDDLNTWDIIEWCGEALELIGASTQYEDCWAELDVTNHVHPLPQNFHIEMQVSFNGTPLHLTSGTMGPGGTTEPGTNFLDTVPVNSDEFPRLNLNMGNIEEYYIKNGCIVTSFESGTIVLAYKGIKVDCDGYPMIPDNVYFDKALKAYAQYMMDRKEWRRGNVTRDVYAESKADWLFYVQSAASAALMPNIDKVENIKNSWVRLKPRLNEHDTFFSGLNIRETNRLK